jgi:hypothetical protein
MAATTTRSFLWLSDFHLDPFYGSPSAVSSSWNSGCTTNDAKISRRYGQIGCDAPMALVEEVLRCIVSVTTTSSNNGSISNPIDFILISGDFSRHGTDQLNHALSETENIIETIATAIKKSFPSTPVVPSIGNNDVFPDYFLDAEVESYDNNILNISIQGFHTFFLSEEELNNFSKGGYFARDVSEVITVLSLNTVVYSVNHQPSQTYLDDPMGQFAWMEEQFKRALQSGRSLYILGHIPPTIGSYRHSQFWHDQYVEKFFSVVDGYKGIIVGHLFGHLHTEEFRLLQPFGYGSLSIPLLLASSVSPVYGSNPSFRLVSYNSDTGELIDLDTYFLDLEKTYSSTTNDSVTPVWTKLPSFTDSYQVTKRLLSDNIEDILSRMSEPDYDDSTKSIWNTFLERQNVYSSQSEEISCDKTCRIDWLCTLKAASKDDYYSCTIDEDGAAGYWRIQYMLAFVTTVIVMTASICIVAFRSFMKRRQFTQVESDVVGDIEVDERGESACNASVLIIQGEIA